ncbi:predicted protein [Plenodomus lingam JN3]|uniref:Predicted protein n=1 Tax=Leptosphaeria maculans (strain JN3 / isolate v23.1.3 / race Av1-4-5-6-7-8) TaxID=985895 RepID=E5R544_LEPMJ|nr:predicted protein [Plenodomus lingam JN3]CBX92014.1 predicted protein [Plenodomus lingam JN3]
MAVCGNTRRNLQQRNPRTSDWSSSATYRMSLPDEWLDVVALRQRGLASQRWVVRYA